MGTYVLSFVPVGGILRVLNSHLSGVALAHSSDI